jgi:hypothetical protein
MTDTKAPTKIDELAFDVTQLQNEIKPTLERIEVLKKEILDLTPKPENDEGNQTFKESFYKIVTKFGFRRTPDQAKVQALFHPDNKKHLRTIALVFPQVYKLDLKQYRAAEDMNPELFKLITTAVTSKPSKPSISIELLPPEEN